MGTIDIRTISLVTGLSLFTVSFSMAYYSLSQKTYPGFGKFTVGNILIGFGLALAGFRPTLPSVITVVAANALIYSALSLFYLGFKSFSGKKCNLYVHFTIVIVLSAVIHPYLTYIEPSVNARIVLVSFAAALYFLFCALVLVREIDYTVIKLNKLLAATLIFITIFLAARGIFHLFSGKHYKGLFVRRSLSRNCPSPSNCFFHLTCSWSDAIECPDAGKRSLL